MSDGPMQAPVAAAIECVIRAEPETDLLRIEAVARSTSPASGRYRLLVAKRSAGGSTSSAQSGTFTLEPGREQVLTTIVLDRSAIGHYHAELALQSDQETSTCTSP
jgi:curli production assembly/transport CsgH protein